jgi:hypothetical protein
MTGHVACMGNRRGAHRVLVGRPECKRPVQRSRHRREDNINIDPHEMEWRDRDWIDLVQDKDRWGGGALVTTVRNSKVS